MKLIVGLGNPGIEYQFTPHNAGFLALDRIAEHCGVTLANRRGRALTAKATLAGHEVLLAKPETYMNLSGLSVAALVHELEIPIPSHGLDCDLRRVGSSAGHTSHSRARLGERAQRSDSISGALGTQEWLRIRIGVGKPPLADGTEVKAGGTDYLLSPMRKQELAVLDEVLDRVRGAVEAILSQGVSAAMNEFNRSSGEL